MEWTPQNIPWINPKCSRNKILTKECLISEAENVIFDLNADGGTNINDALIKAVEMANTKQEKFKEIDQTMIVFLTDGEPTVGIQDVTEIKKNIREANANHRIPIYGLAFGDDADFD